MSLILYFAIAFIVAVAQYLYFRWTDGDRIDKEITSIVSCIVGLFWILALPMMAAGLALFMVSSLVRLAGDKIAKKFINK
jgi:hypothetical protein